MIKSYFGKLLLNFYLKMQDERQHYGLQLLSLYLANAYAKTEKGTFILNMV